MPKDWNKEAALGCLECALGSTPKYISGAGPLCNIGAAMDKKYLKRMQKLLSGADRFAVIKFRGIKTKQQLIYFPDRETIKTHLENILDVVINLRHELKSRGLLKVV